MGWLLSCISVCLAICHRVTDMPSRKEGSGGGEEVVDLPAATLRTARAGMSLEAIILTVLCCYRKVSGSA